MLYSNYERPFPSHWHPSRVLPSVLPRRSIESDFLLTPIRHHVPRCYPRIHEALSAPSLTGYDTYGTARQKSPHFMHALRGDSTVRMALVREGERRGLGLHATAQLASAVGSNAALSEMCVTCGLLEIALHHCQQLHAADIVAQKTAADIMEALLGAAEEFIGVHATSRWFLEIAMPWIDVAVRYKSKPTPLHPEFSSGVNPATRPTGQEDMPIFRPADTWRPEKDRYARAQPHRPDVRPVRALQVKESARVRALKARMTDRRANSVVRQAQKAHKNKSEIERTADDMVKGAQKMLEDEGRKTTRQAIEKMPEYTPPKELHTPTPGLQEKQSENAMSNVPSTIPEEPASENVSVQTSLVKTEHMSDDTHSAGDSDNDSDWYELTDVREAPDWQDMSCISEAIDLTHLLTSPMVPRSPSPTWSLSSRSANSSRSPSPSPHMRMEYTPSKPQTGFVAGMLSGSSPPDSPER